MSHDSVTGMLQSLWKLYTVPEIDRVEEAKQLHKYGHTILQKDHPFEKIKFGCQEAAFDFVLAILHAFEEKADTPLCSWADNFRFQLIESLKRPDGTTATKTQPALVYNSCDPVNDVARGTHSVDPAGNTHTYSVQRNVQDQDPKRHTVNRFLVTNCQRILNASGEYVFPGDRAGANVSFAPRLVFDNVEYSAHCVIFHSGRATVQRIGGHYICWVRWSTGKHNGDEWFQCNDDLITKLGALPSSAPPGFNPVLTIYVQDEYRSEIEPVTEFPKGIPNPYRAMFACYMNVVFQCFVSLGLFHIIAPSLKQHVHKQASAVVLRTSRSDASTSVPERLSSAERKPALMALGNVLDEMARDMKNVNHEHVHEFCGVSTELYREHKRQMQFLYTSIQDSQRYWDQLKTTFKKQRMLASFWSGYCALMNSESPCMQTFLRAFINVATKIPNKTRSTIVSLYNGIQTIGTSEYKVLCNMMPSLTLDAQYEINITVVSEEITHQILNLVQDKKRPVRMCTESAPLCWPFLTRVPVDPADHMVFACAIRLHTLIARDLYDPNREPFVNVLRRVVCCCYPILKGTGTTWICTNILLDWRTGTVDQFLEIPTSFVARSLQGDIEPLCTLRCLLVQNKGTHMYQYIKCHPGVKHVACYTAYMLHEKQTSEDLGALLYNHQIIFAVYVSTPRHVLRTPQEPDQNILPYDNA